MVFIEGVNCRIIDSDFSNEDEYNKFTVIVDEYELISTKIKLPQDGGLKFLVKALILSKQTTLLPYVQLKIMKPLKMVNS